MLGKSLAYGGNNTGHFQKFNPEPETIVKMKCRTTEAVLLNPQGKGEVRHADHY